MEDDEDKWKAEREGEEGTEGEHKEEMMKDVTRGRLRERGKHKKRTGRAQEKEIERRLEEDKGMEDESMTRGRKGG